MSFNSHDRATLKKAIDEFIAAKRSEGLKPYTLETYQRSLHKLSAYLQVQNLFDIDAAMLRAFFLQLQSAHNVGGVEVYYRPIKAFFNWYWFEYELDRKNPINFVKVQHQKVIPRHGIPMEDVQRLYQSCKGPFTLRDRAIFYALIDTCARATELCHLQIQHVDPASGTVFIVQGKGDKSRYVRLGVLTLRALKRYLHTRVDLREDDPLFVTKYELPFNRDSLRLLLERHIRTAGIKHVSLHDFRRRGAYEMWLATRDLQSVSLYLGHSTPTVTQRYLGIRDEDVLEAHRRASPVDRWRL